MPTYEFKCVNCNEKWTEQQSINIKQTAHTSKCPKCTRECENIAFGGTGFQFSGRLLNNQLTDFPDYANKINRGAEKDAKEMEKYHDAYIREHMKKKESK
jgi:putative FmdB family regulatory protein